MKALGVEPGDEVITTAHSWISTSETITQAGGKVVFCGVNENDFLLDISKVYELITPNTKVSYQSTYMDRQSTWIR